ncbi:cupredoxin family protein [Pelomonas sp. V22]|uniref:cupredoxin domain-containing protein n=1 Tax=Pelomonas sp. V22 TaxID=2822139 RepID=UPI0024A861F5|nr:cupredoxin family protein [Pelomonas sp. V22]MDI4635226.1 cupredoxin family protein [Pelomonas sp. V22]
MKFTSHRTLSALVFAFASTSVLASGNHPGGHGHDSDAIGKPGVAAKASRTVQIDMTDAMRFTPSSVEVKQGETVRFVVKNSGQVKHEMVLGTEKELKEHYELMKKNPEMEHADENMVTVAPGKSGEIVWQFTKAGKIDFACLQPGHYDAGMKGAVKVSAKGAAPKADGHADHKH